MRKALAGAAGASPAAILLLAAAGALLAGALFFGGGSSEGPVAWIGAGTVLVAAGVVGAALVGALPVPRLGREGLLFFGAAAAFVIWSGLSAAWSAAPDRSWGFFNRGLVYLLFAVVGLFAASLEPRAPRRVAAGLALLISGVAAWALAGKVVPALYEDYGRFARLRSPVGYWNGLALVLAFGLPLALWAATRPGRRRLERSGAVTLLYALLVALVLTYSRGGLLAALVALGVWLALSDERFESAAALVSAGVPAALVLAVALSLPGIADDGQPHDVRVRDGAWFGLVLALGAGLAFAAAYLVRYRPGPERRRLLLRAAAVAAGVALVAGAGVGLSHGNPLRSDVVGSQSTRLTTLGSNNRWGWWGEALEAFEDEPLVGTGAGSFELVHLQLRDSRLDVTTEPHNLALQLLGETGLVGLLLAAAAAASAFAGAWLALGRLAGEQRAAAVALAVVLPTYLSHALLDYDWDFVAVNAPVFLVAGVLLSAGRPAAPAARRPIWALASVLVALAALYSLAAPRLAARKVDAAYAALDAPGKAVDDARAAHSLDPLSVEPLYAWASAEQARGHSSRARELYVDAVDLQPLNADAWYQLGCFELEVFADRASARRYLERARELDPFGPARDVLESGALSPAAPPRSASARC